MSALGPSGPLVCIRKGSIFGPKIGLGKSLRSDIRTPTKTHTHKGKNAMISLKQSASSLFLSEITVKLDTKNHSKTCVKKSAKLFFKTNYRLMQVKNIAECSKGSILQYF